MTKARKMDDANAASPDKNVNPGKAFVAPASMCHEYRTPGRSVENAANDTLPSKTASAWQEDQKPAIPVDVLANPENETDAKDQLAKERSRESRCHEYRTPTR